MRQVLYRNNPLTLIPMDQIEMDQIETEQSAFPAKPKPGARLVRWIAHRWDLVGILALIGSSAAYGVYALVHLGL